MGGIAAIRETLDRRFFEPWATCSRVTLACWTHQSKPANHPRRKFDLAGGLFRPAGGAVSNSRRRLLWSKAMPTSRAGVVRAGGAYRLRSVPLDTAALRLRAAD